MSEKEQSVTKQEEFPRKSKFLCLFCGGKSCSKENYLKNLNENAINGLHSDWITSDILAMQRPSTRLIKEFNVIEQFKKAHIQAVFNLQLPGEVESHSLSSQVYLKYHQKHPYCGDNLQKDSGFTYRSEDFTDHGIYYFNFGWTDMEVTSNDYMIKIMTHIDFIINQGMKISVHCHAGTGRTGLLIASWLILKNNMKAIEARDLFRSKRISGLSKYKQLTFLIKFEEFLKSTRISFTNSPKIDLEDFIHQQSKIVFGKEKTLSKYQPFIMHQVLSRLEQLTANKRISAEKMCYSFFDLENKEFSEDQKWGPLQEQQISQLKEQVNNFEWQFSKYADCRIISQMLLDFLDQPQLQVIKNESALKLEQIFEKVESIEMVFANEEIVKLLGRCEYAILTRFLVFIKRNFVDLNLGSRIVNQFILRLCISLLGKRRDLDNIFIERSFLTTECFNPVVFSLYQFISLWLQDMIENQLSDNSYFDKIFNRTSCILEGRKKQASMQSKTKQNSGKVHSEKELDNVSQVSNPSSILIGNHIKKDPLESRMNGVRSSGSNFINVNLLSPIKGMKKGSSQKNLAAYPLLSEQKNSMREKLPGNRGDSNEEEEEKEEKEEKEIKEDKQNKEKTDKKEKNGDKKEVEQFIKN